MAEMPTLDSKRSHLPPVTAAAGWSETVANSRISSCSCHMIKGKNKRRWSELKNTMGDGICLVMACDFWLDL